MRAVILAILVPLLSASCTRPVVAATPQSVMLAFLEDMKANGPAAAVPRFTHPDECVRLKAMLEPRIETAFNERVFGKDITRDTYESTAPCEVLALVLWRAQVAGNDIQTPRVVEAGRTGDIATLKITTSFTDLEGKPAVREDTMHLKAHGETWKLLLSPELEAYVRVLIQESVPQ